MKKRILAGLMVSAMITGSLYGCGGNNTPSENGKNNQKEAEENKTIELWVQWTDGTDKAEFSKEMIKKFEEETGYTVNYTAFTYDMLHEKILTAAAGGNVPDAAFGLPEYIGEFYNMGILEDLTDEFNNWEDKSAFSDAVVKAMMIDGKIVGIPQEMTVRAYLTHEEDFTKAEAEIPETWEELLDMGEFQDAVGKYPFEFTGAGVRSAQELLVYLAQKDLEIASVQEDGKYKNTWNENPEELKKAAEVFKFYNDLLEKGIVDPGAKNWTWEETDDNFCTGLVSSHVTGNWLSNKESQNPETMKDIVVNTIPYPSDGKPVTYLECKPMFIFKDSKNKEGALELLKAISSQEWQEKVQPTSSPRSDVYTDTIWSKDFTDLSDNGITFPPVTLAGVTQAMTDSIAKVLQEGKTPEEAAAWLCDAVNASLSDTGELSEE